MSNSITACGGALRYEFLMQIRRRSVWVSLLLVGLLQIMIYVPHLSELINLYFQIPINQTMAELALMVNTLLPAAFGCLIADRLPRDRRTRVEELLMTMPQSPGVRLIGKYLGSVCATLLPVLVFFLLGTGFVLYHSGNIACIPFALATFGAIILPGILFISAFSLACPAIMWVPLYQFCFVGYWFWGNFLGARNGIPTLNGTILTPSGKITASGIFGLDPKHSGITASAIQGWESLLLLVSLAILVLCILWLVLRWQQARQ
ncbi:hypothetical protein [Dictyobacter aurantiacus]|uniref:Uncharacterized protein n=1 Tax=Dictyobacter aurantiacus TaxID=1936993 RepID=A0A401ZPP2_9CHLR|nr:hypothetical protein [Dictyobacter aurantiacus]GCE08780.1 hypothetical protein KDAU_61090 [Dictyobacter aurantiacus]